MGAVLRDRQGLPSVEVGVRTLHASDAVADLDEAVASAIRSVEAVLAGAARGIGIWLYDAQGTLHLTAIHGDCAAVSDQIEALRHEALEHLVPGSMELPSSLEPHRLAIFPLAHRGIALGSLEVVLLASDLGRTAPALEAIATQSALMLAALPRVRPTRSIARVDAGDLTLRLLRCKTPHEAVAETVAICIEQLGLSVAGWVARHNSSSLGFVAAGGIDPRLAAGLSEAHPTIGWGRLGSSSRYKLRREIAELVGATTVDAIEAGHALLMVAGAPDEEARRTLDVLRVVLGYVLEQQLEIEDARERRGLVDLAIARTGHELRGPLAGAQKAIAQVLWAGQTTSEQRNVLRRTEQELRDLSVMVEALLRWGLTDRPLTRRQFNLVTVVKKAVRGAVAETGQDRVVVVGPGRVPVKGDARHLRGAVANLVRNALAYSPPDEPVVVTLGTGNDKVTVTVEDRGPGFGPDDPAGLFGPLIRGSAGRSRPDGKGLGLFIAKQVVEAHDGKIWAEPGCGGGAVFHVEIPVGNGGKTC